jgi:hypothetical protein
VADEGRAIVIAVIVGVGLALVKCELRKERHALREPTADEIEAEARPAPRVASEVRAPDESAARDPVLGRAVALYSGALPEYPAAPRIDVADNAKVLRRLVGSLEAFEQGLVPDQIRRLRTTLYVVQNGYQDALGGAASVQVDQLLRAEIASFLDADQYRRYLRATEGSPSMLLGVGAMTVPAPVPEVAPPQPTAGRTDRTSAGR